MTSRKHLTYANLVATLALVVASAAGTSYAADKIKLPKNSVASKQLKNGGVATKDLANGAVDNSKLAPSTLAALGQPRAYGAVKADGTVVPSRSKGATVVKLPQPGRYCVNPSGFDALGTTIVVAADYTAGNGLGHFAQGVETTSAAASAACPGGFAIITHRLDGAGVAVDQDQGFTFLIP